MSNLIKEAIADAKAMREMAVAQAKAALEEAFEPQIHSVITKKIQAEMDGDDEELEPEIEEDIEYGAAEDEHEEAKENSGLTEEADTSDIGQADNKEPSAASSEESTEDIEGEVELGDGHEDAKENSGLTEEVEDEEDEEEMEFESILRELEDEAEEMEIEEPEVEDELGEADDEELDIEVEPEAEVEPEVEVEPEAEVEDEVEMAPEGDEEEELDLESLFGEVEGEEDEEEKFAAMESKISALTAKLKEALKVVKYQKDKLNEVNILNAKLLFTNKVFRGFNLDNKAKVKIIENFDRAKNVREVKLVYATLMENLAVGEKREAKKAQRLVEGASKAVKSTNSQKKIVDDSNEVKSRIHKLMGLK